MNSKMKFHEMTKPIKFRRLKMVKQMIVLWCKAQRERIIYLTNYSLYKLNILKRYSYRDNVAQYLPLPHDLKDKEIISNYFGGVVKMKLLLNKDIDIDYFYWQRKDGSRKITLSLKEHTESRLFAVSNLDNIHIKVDRWYKVDHLPVFKVASFEDLEPVSFVGSAPTKPLDVETVEYDIMKLKTLTHKSLLGDSDSTDYISEGMLKYYYDYACGEFEKYLNNLTLADIMK